VPARRSPYFGCATATSGAGGAAWDVEALTSFVGCCNITQPSSRITSTSGVCSGADAGWPPNCPTQGEHHHQRHPPPPHGPPRTGSLDEPAGALVKGCGEPTHAMSPPRSSPPLVVAPWPQSRRATLVRCHCARLRSWHPHRSRPVVVGTPNLSALVGAREGTISITLSTRKAKE
jgi:hypothetical protein